MIIVTVSLPEGFVTDMHTFINLFIQTLFILARLLCEDVHLQWHEVDQNKDKETQQQKDPYKENAFIS